MVADGAKNRVVSARAWLGFVIKLSHQGNRHFDWFPIVQSAAIPYRYDSTGNIEVLLVTSRRKGRWGLPKGHVPKGMAAHLSAAREAFEEAGVLGKVEQEPIGSYLRFDASPKSAQAVRIEVYPMKVTTEAPTWPEMHQRTRLWATVAEAIELVRSDGMRHALSAFCEACDVGRPSCD